MNFILFDSPVRANLLPFTHTRPVADIRCGIFTMRERWEALLGEQTGSLTEEYLQTIFPTPDRNDTVYINAAVFGNKEIIDSILLLQTDEALSKDGLIIAVRLSNYNENIRSFNEYITKIIPTKYEGRLYSLTNLWDIFSLNEQAIKDDFAIITSGWESAPIPTNIIVTGEEYIFIEKGAKIGAGCIINATTGPVYIGKEAEIMEGAIIRGPFAACKGSTIKLGAKIYGATTIGPGCKVGGEVSNVVFFANSNKAHDGFLGNSVIGEWCNLGADTNSSNLKNNYSTVSIWHEASATNISTGLTFCGLMMGDHSKCGINTMFNTGTVVGVACNIYGGGFPDKHIPSFSWGGSEGFTDYQFDKATETMSRVMQRRGLTLSAAATQVFKYIYEHK